MNRKIICLAMTVLCSFLAACGQADKNNATRSGEASSYTTGDGETAGLGDTESMEMTETAPEDPAVRTAQTIAYNYMDALYDGEISSYKLTIYEDDHTVTNLFMRGDGEEYQTIMSSNGASSYVTNLVYKDGFVWGITKDDAGNILDTQFAKGYPQYYPSVLLGDVDSLSYVGAQTDESGIESDVLIRSGDDESQATTYKFDHTSGYLISVTDGQGTTDILTGYNATQIRLPEEFDNRSAFEAFIASDGEPESQDEQ